MTAASRRQFLGSALATVLAKAAPGEHPLEGIRRENIRITDVRVTLLSYELPPDKQWMTADILVWKTDAVLVEVLTDKGITGIGESSPYGGPERIKQFIESFVRPALLGRNPFDVEHLAGAWAGPRVHQIPWAGVDAALWDIIGKAKGRSVWNLLAAGTAPDPHLRIYASGGVEYAWYKRPEDLIEEAVRHKENGYTAFKFRIGTDWKRAGMTAARFIPWLEKLRAAVGPAMDLMLEGNMRLTLEEALDLCPVLEQFRFLWFEEPVPQRAEGAVERHIQINRALPRVMVSGGEQLATRSEFKEWIDRDAYDIVQPDANTTGLTEAWHIARMAHLKGKPCCPHNWHGGLTTMDNAALVAAIPNRLVLELNQTFNPLKEEVFKEPLVVRKGYMDLPDKPGFGVELAPDLPRKFPCLPGTYYKPNPAMA